MKKTARLLLIGLFILFAGVVTMQLTQENILPASMFILSGGFCIESARLTLIQIK